MNIVTKNRYLLTAIALLLIIINHLSASENQTPHDNIQFKGNVIAAYRNERDANGRSFIVIINPHKKNPLIPIS